MTIQKLLLAVVVSLLLSDSARGQVATAELSGTVLDASGAGVPKAKVTAISADTNVLVRQTESGAGGEYLMTFLPPGNYTLSVEATGFRKSTQTGVRLEVNQRARLDFTLQVGQVTEIVEVAAAAPLLESQSS